MVSSEDVRRALEKSLGQIVEAVRATIEDTPPELLADIMSNGIFLSGGGSMLRGFDALLAAETKMKVNIVEDPLTAVARGGGIVLEQLEAMKSILLATDSSASPH
jgi:rod shape-determining protein MreB